MNDIVKSQPVVTTQLPMTASEQSAAMMQIFRDAVMAPDAEQKVTVLRAMMDMQREMINDQEQREMNQIIADLDIPTVKKNGKIPLPSKDGVTRDVAFAKWEDVSRVLKPILKARGLGLRFDTQPRVGDGGGCVVIGYLSYKKIVLSAQVSVPLDTGPGRNNLQAMGSSISYGKRYVTFMLLNIVAEGEDDNGAGADSITLEQAAEIDLRLRETGADIPRFLKWIGAPAVPSIQAKNYNKAMAELKKKAVSKKGIA